MLCQLKLTLYAKPFNFIKFVSLKNYIKLLVLAFACNSQEIEKPTDPRGSTLSFYFRAKILSKKSKQHIFPIQKISFNILNQNRNCACSGLSPIQYLTTEKMIYK